MNDLIGKLVASVETTNNGLEKYSNMLKTMEALINDDGLFGHLDEEELLDKLTDAYDDAEEYDSVF